MRQTAQHTTTDTFSLAGYDYRKEVNRPIHCRNAADARKIAKFYIDDDHYLKYSPDRMVSIAYQLLKYGVCQAALHQIIEVCSAHCTIDFVTVRSKV